MDLIDKLRSVEERVLKLKDRIETEEATKNAFIMPFISALGYDVFNPLEVVPEFTADLGLKKGEKVDYCIKKDDEAIMIIECKHWAKDLDVHSSQLHRYFHVTKSRFGILTNGIVYRFYTDLEEPNKMDDTPFFEFSMNSISEQVVNELKKFSKGSFDIEAILSTASDLKYSKQIKEFLGKQLKEPGEDFVKFVASNVYPGKVTAKVREQFSTLVKKSSTRLINEMINSRLQTAITPAEEEEEEEELEAVEDNGVETTEEELQGFRVVQAVLMQTIESERVTHRDTKSYFGILLDDNNRKPICRLWFNRRQKYIEIFDENRKGEKMPVDKISDIYNYKEGLIRSVSNYLEDTE